MKVFNRVLCWFGWHRVKHFRVIGDYMKGVEGICFCQKKVILELLNSWCVSTWSQNEGIHIKPKNYINWRV